MKDYKQAGDVNLSEMVQSSYVKTTILLNEILEKLIEFSQGKQLKSKRVVSNRYTPAFGMKQNTFTDAYSNRSTNYKNLSSRKKMLNHRLKKKEY